MEKETLMDVDAASHIQSAAAHDPEFDSAQSTADQSEYDDVEVDAEDDAEDDV